MKLPALTGMLQSLTGTTPATEVSRWIVDQGRDVNEAGGFFLC